MKCPVLVCVDTAEQSFPQSRELHPEPSDLYTDLVSPPKVLVNTAASHRSLADADTE